MKEARTTIAVSTIIFLAIIAVGSFYRLHELDLMAYHHDESIHEFYSYKLYEHGPGSAELGKSSPPYYSAVYHGPFYYHWSAFLFLLFGDTAYTGRLPYALFGIALLFAVYSLKLIVGKRTALIMTLFCAVSPCLVYFSRFSREDVYMGTCALMMVSGALWYWHTQKARYFIISVLGMVIAYSVKESSYVGGATLCSFLVMYCVLHLIFRKGNAKTSLVESIFSTHWIFAFTVLLYGLFSFFMVGYVELSVKKAWFPQDYRNASFWAYWVLLFGGSTAIAYLTLYLTRYGHLSRAADSAGQVRVPSIKFLLPRDLLLLTVGILAIVTIVFSCLLVFDNYSAAEIKKYTLFIVGAVAFAGAGLFMVRFLHIAAKAQEDPSNENPMSAILLKDTLLLIGVLAVVLGIYSALFTVCFTKTRGLIDGVYLYLSYWLKMHKTPRIPGPSTYYVCRLLLYEPLAVLLSITAAFYYIYRLVMWYIMRTNAAMTEKYPIPNWLPFLFLYWGLCAIVIYGVLQEKVQWLLYHQALPLLLLAGVFVGELHERIGPGALRRCFWVVVSLLLAYEVRSTTLCTHFEPDDPKELLVYTQTSHDVVEVVKEIEQYSQKLRGMGEKPIVHMQGETPWPFSWYLRHYETRSGMVNSQEVPLIVTDSDQKSRMNAVLEDKFYGRELHLRVWWQPGQAWSDMSHSKEWWYKLLRWMIYREPWDEKYLGSTNFMFYVRKDLLPHGGKTSKEQQSADIPPITPTLGSQPLALELVEAWGKQGAGVGEFNEPRGIAIAPTSRMIYVADSKNHRIQALKPTGEFGFAWGKAGEESNQFNEPAGVCVGTGADVFVADLWNNRALRFDAKGNPKATLNSKAGAFFGPRSVAITPEGKFYIVDTGNARVEMFDINGGPGAEWGSKGNKSGKFSEPVGIAISKDGRVYVADTGNKRIQIFDPGAQNKCVSVWSVPGWSNPQGEPYLAFDSQGNLYATDSFAARILRFSPDGKKVDALTLNSQNPEGSLLKPTGIAIDAEDNIYITDRETARILKVRAPVSPAQN